MREIEDEELRFIVVMDLWNLRLVSAKENQTKGNNIDSNVVQCTIKILNKKYKLNISLC